MNRGYVVRYSDGTYFSAASDTRKTDELQEATVCPQVDNFYMRQMGIKHQDGWNVPMLQIGQVGGVAELVEIVFDIVNIRPNDGGGGRVPEGRPEIVV